MDDRRRWGNTRFFQVVASIYWQSRSCESSNKMSLSSPANDVTKIAANFLCCKSETQMGERLFAAFDYR